MSSTIRNVAYNMSNRPYTVDPNGHLIWDWEKKKFKIKEEDKKMPFKKLCYFCKKSLTGSKIAYVNVNNIKKHVCSMCEYLFKVISREYENGREKVLAKILSTIVTKSRHCNVCKHFDFKKKHYCKKGMWTGVEKNQHEYPNSFANSGCGKYTHF